MRLLVTADWHLSSFKNTYMNMKEQLAEGLRVLRSIIKDQEPDAIIVAGDIFHDKVLLYKTALDLFVDEFLDPLTSSGYKQPVILIAGNHDMGRSGCLLNDHIIRGFNNVFVIADHIGNYENGRGVLVPFPLANLEDMAEAGSEEDALYLISHFGLNEARLNNGLSRLSPIRLHQLSMYRMILLGHYHTPQSLTITRQGQKTTAIYTGSLVPLSWNDKNEKKRVLIVDTDKIAADPELAYESIPIQSPYIKEFKEYIIDNTLSEDKVYDILERALKNAKQHIVRVVVPSLPKCDISKQLDQLRSNNVGVLTLTQDGLFESDNEGGGDEIENKWLGKNFNELCEQYMSLYPDQGKLAETLEAILSFEDE